MPDEYSSANVDNNIDMHSLNLYPDDAPHDLLPITNLGQGNYFADDLWHGRTSL